MKLNCYFVVAAIVMMFTACTSADRTLQIIFTNDSHSQVEEKDGFGGFEARAVLIDSLRSVNPNTLLLDAGDMWQGSPYFNMFGGRLEVQAYNLMGYDVVTLGNHEFDNGVDSLAARMAEMNFDVVCANYDFGTTPLSQYVKPYVVIDRNGWRVGIIGVSVNPAGLISEKNIDGIEYDDPVIAVNKYAALLKQRERCDMVIVLSHLGFHNDGSLLNPADDELAALSNNVDLILGGHTHPMHGVRNIVDLSGDTVTVLQDKKSGLNLYRITVEKRP